MKRFKNGTILWTLKEYCFSNEEKDVFRKWIYHIKEGKRIQKLCKKMKKPTSWEETMRRFT